MEEIFELFKKINLWLDEIENKYGTNYPDACKHAIKDALNGVRESMMDLIKCLEMTKVLAAVVEDIYLRGRLPQYEDDITRRFDPLTLSLNNDYYPSDMMFFHYSKRLDDPKFYYEYFADPFERLEKTKEKTRQAVRIWERVTRADRLQEWADK
jgi:hypothetical protein